MLQLGGTVCACLHTYMYRVYVHVFVYQLPFLVYGFVYLTCLFLFFSVTLPTRGKGKRQDYRYCIIPRYDYDFS